MATLQVKHLPDELHASLAARARELDVTMSELVTRMLRRELARPTVEEWASRIVSRGDAVRPIDVGGALDEVRVEYAPDHRAQRAR